MFELTKSETIDWQLLRDQGLKYLGSLDNPLWNYFDLKDPGVTLLEAACYGIDELVQRLDMTFENVITPVDEQEAARKQFFTPKEILTVNPLTLNDYRKLFIDIKGVRNAWVDVLPAEEHVLYRDSDNARRSFHGAANAHPVALKGLLNITLEQEDDLVKISEATLRESVRRQFHAHRNLCEDLVGIDILQPQIAYIFADIEVHKNIDVDEFVAQLFRQIEEFIEPVVPQLALQSLLKKAYPIETIFNGPRLENGFILDEDLLSRTQRQELYASDLIRIMMGFGQVKDVHFVSMATDQFADAAERQEWVLPLDKTRVLRLANIQELPLRIFQSGVLVELNLNKISQRIAQLRQATIDARDGGERDIAVPFGLPQNLTHYAEIQNRLTENYGLSELGLPFEASAQERANAKQLRAYLLFFDQILANLFAQLGHVKQTLAIQQPEQRETYHSQVLGRTQPETATKELFAEVREKDFLDALANDDARDFDRRNRIMTHLLARFNESFPDFSLLSLKRRDYLRAKGKLLENYDRLSRERSRAYDYVSTPSLPDARANGLQQMLNAKLGLSEEEQSGVLIIEHILLRPVKTDTPLQFAIYDQDSEQGIAQGTIENSTQADTEPYSFYLTCYIANDIGRFKDSGNFYDVIEQLLAKETPAHFKLNIKQRTLADITQIKTAYEDYLQQRALFLSGQEHSVQLSRRNILKALNVTQCHLPSLHLDASFDGYRNDVILADETHVSQWRDLSSYRQAIEFDAPSRPQVLPAALAGHDILLFNHQPLTVTAFNGQNISLAMVYTLEANGGDILSVYSGEQTEDQTEELSEDAFIYIGADNQGMISATIKAPGGSTQTLSVQTTNGIAHFLTLRASDSPGSQQQQWQLSIDGVMTSRTELLPVNANQSAALTYVLGKGNIAIGEFLVVDSALKVELYQALTDYFSVKWGVPASHAHSFGTPQFYFDASVEHSVEKTLSGEVLSWTGLSQKPEQAQQALLALRPTFTYDSVGILSTLSFKHSQLLLPNPLRSAEGLALELSLFMLVSAHQSGTLFDSIHDSTGLRLRVDNSNRLVLETPNDSLSLQRPSTGLMLVAIEKLSGSDVLTLTLNGQYTASKSFIDAAAIASGAAELSLGMNRGADQSTSGFGGELAELLLYPQVLEKPRRQQLERILANKWQIDLTGVKAAAVPVLQLDANQFALLERDEAEGLVVWQDHRAAEPLRDDTQNYQAVQTLSHRRPSYETKGINGLPVVRFNEATELTLTRIIEKSFSLFIVYSATGPGLATGHENWTQGCGLLDADVHGQYNDFGLSIGDNGAVMAGVGERIGQDTHLVSDSLAFNTPHLICFKRDHSSGVIELRVDRLAVGQADLSDGLLLNDTNSLTLGALRNKGPSLNGVMGEVLIFDRPLDSVQVGLVEAYLGGKWGVG